MLGYVFWHRRAGSAAREDYERSLIEFHQALRGALVASASFRVERLPFTATGGYEDWYLVESWAALGELNDAAVSEPRAGPHDVVAGLAGEGWGAVYGLVRGTPAAPAGVRWMDKPDGERYEAFLRGVRAEALWQRQLVLGPAPEFCLGVERSEGRLPVWPSRP
jgi:hypothetical protein